MVEDDDDSREMLATMVQSLGYPVVTATNGAEGLSLAREHRPCLILLDLIMPMMNGETFRAEQLADEDMRHIPVVVVTGTDDPHVPARRLEALGYIRKPLNYEEVAERVAAYCEAAR